MYYVYILQSEKDHKYYIGRTNNLHRRIDEHNRGHSASTRSRIPFKLVYFEKYDTINKSIHRERLIKSYKGGNEFKKLINDKRE